MQPGKCARELVREASPGRVKPDLRRQGDVQVAPDAPQRVLGGLNQLGAPLWAPPGPNGFPDTNAAWASPEGMKLRLDMAAGMAGRMQALNPNTLLDEGYGAAASQATRQAIARAESKQQGMALLLLSPEMQRR